MARDDYHVIVYQILAYLYVQLKAGKPVDPELLMPDSKYLGINKKYWIYVMNNLVKDGLIDHVTITETWTGEYDVLDLVDAEITPRGIEYLCDNSFINKAKEFLKDVKAIVPFI